MHSLKVYKQSNKASTISADTFNNHFVSVADTHNIGVCDSSNSNRLSVKIKEFCGWKMSLGIAFSIPQLAIHEAGTYIMSLMNTKSTGLDGSEHFFTQFLILVDLYIQPLFWEKYLPVCFAKGDGNSSSKVKKFIITLRLSPYINSSP